MSDSGKRKTYNKPKIRVIELRAEETLDRACRTMMGGPGFAGGACAMDGCFQPGST